MNGGGSLTILVIDRANKNTTFDMDSVLVVAQARLGRNSKKKSILPILFHKNLIMADVMVDMQ